MKIMKTAFLSGMFLLISCVLGACQNNNAKIISSNEADYFTVVVKKDEGAEDTTSGKDPTQIKYLLGNIESLFGNSTNGSTFSDTEITDQEKAYGYQVVFYKEDKVVQEITISQKNKVTVDKENYTIGTNKEKDLDNLKKHLLTITQ